MKTKHLYKTAIIGKHKCYVEYSWAYSEKQAQVMSIERVSKKQNIHPAKAFIYYKEHKDKIKTTIEIEMEDE